MIKSMTGYGRARENRNGRDITAEVRSVNNRYLDCTVKLPRAYIFAEDAVKTRVQKAVSRGKVDVFITMESAGSDDAVVTVNEALAKAYLKALSQLEALGGKGGVTATELARFPDVVTVTKAEEDLEAIAADICAVVEQALAAYNEMRAVEGRKLAEDIVRRSGTIEQCVAVVEERSPQTVEEYRQKLYAKMQEVLSSANIDEGRILQEAAIYADKVAVDEETVRLRSHIHQLRTMAESVKPVGRDMDFLVQEFNRECNTIGSKCKDLKITETVLQMKAEVEKIREQVQNVE